MGDVMEYHCMHWPEEDCEDYLASLMEAGADDGGDFMEYDGVRDLSHEDGWYDADIEPDMYDDDPEGTMERSPAKVLSLVPRNGKDESLLGIVEEMLRDRDWKFHRLPGTSSIRTGVRGDNADFNIIFSVREDVDWISLAVEYSPFVPDSKRKEAAEFITRANSGLYLGCFMLDMDEGDVRYRISIDVEGGVLTKAMVDNMMGTAINTADRYFPSFMSVCFGNAIPSAAIREVD